ncbi:MAG: hypothetical protein QG629_529 [Patescibacteria group bacterium]|nr:hypothetical protein [Patescibacteria group bacterium]
MILFREKSSQSEKSHFFALRDEKNHQVCLMDKKEAK